MSLPQIQYQLTGRPRLLAGSTWFFLNLRPISYALAGAMPARAVSSQTHALGEVSIGLNPELSVSTSRDAFLGQQFVSPPLCVDDQSNTDGDDECSSRLAQLRKGVPDQ